MKFVTRNANATVFVYKNYKPEKRRRNLKETYLQIYSRHNNIKHSDNFNDRYARLDLSI